MMLNAMTASLPGGTSTSWTRIGEGLGIGEGSGLRTFFLKDDLNHWH
jgi:hypothetical protein